MSSMTGRGSDDAVRDDEIDLHDEDEEQQQQQRDLAVNGREGAHISSIEEEEEFSEFTAPDDTVSITAGRDEDGIPSQQNGDVAGSPENSLQAAGSIDDGGSIPDDTPSVQVRSLSPLYMTCYCC